MFKCVKIMCLKSINNMSTLNNIHDAFNVFNKEYNIYQLMYKLFEENCPKNYVTIIRSKSIL